MLPVIVKDMIIGPDRGPVLQPADEKGSVVHLGALQGALSICHSNIGCSYSERHSYRSGPRASPIKGQMRNLLVE